MEIFSRSIGGIVKGLATYVNRNSGAESPWGILESIGIRRRMSGKQTNIIRSSKLHSDRKLVSVYLENADREQSAILIQSSQYH